MGVEEGVREGEGSGEREGVAPTLCEGEGEGAAHTTRRSACAL